MQDIDLSGISPALFVTVAFFLMLSLSFLSVGVLQVVQKKFRSTALFAALGVVSIALFVVVIQRWFV